MLTHMFWLIVVALSTSVLALDTLEELRIIDAEKNITSSYITAVKKLKKVRLNTPEIEDNLEQALVQATEMANEQLMQLLLDSGVNPNGQNVTDIEMSALFKALLSDNPAILQKLLDHGVDLNLQDKRYGDTALTYAARNNMPHVCQVLIAHHASIDTPNKSGNTPLIFAVKNRALNCVQLLIEAGAQQNAHDLSKKTPLMHACIEGATDIAAYLLEHHAEIDDQDNNDCTALMYACRSKNIPLIALIIRNGAQLDIVDHHDENALDYLMQDVDESDEQRTLLSCFFGAWREKVIKEIREKNGEILIYFHLNKTQELVDLLTYGNFATEYACKTFIDKHLPWILFDYETDEIITHELMFHFMKDLIHNLHRHSITQQLHTYLQPGFSVADNPHEELRQQILSNLLQYAPGDYLDMAHACLYDEDEDEEITIDSDILQQRLENIEAAHAPAILNHHRDGALLLSQLNSPEELALLPLLIEKGITLDTQNDNGQTALMQAINDQNFSCAHRLIHAGANLTITDLEDRTALEHVLEIDTVQPTPVDSLKEVITLIVDRQPALINRRSTPEQLTPLVRLLKNFEPIDFTPPIKIKLRRLINYMLSQGADAGIETLYGTTPADIAHQMDLEDIVEDLCSDMYDSEDRSDPFLSSAQALIFFMEHTPNRNPQFLKEISDLQKRLYCYQHTKIKQSKLNAELATLSERTAHGAIAAIDPQTLVDGNGAGSFMLYQTYQCLCMTDTISKMPGLADHTPESMRIVHPSLGQYLQEIKKRPLTFDDYPLVDPITKDGIIVSLDEMNELLKLTEPSPKIETLTLLLRDTAKLQTALEAFDIPQVDKDEVLALISENKVNLHSMAALTARVKK